MGISRSATVVAAYLIYRHGLTPSQALQWIKFQRSISNPNSGFRQQLEDYYSVLLIDHPAHPDQTSTFGWKHLSMCSDFAIDKDREFKKGHKRRRVECVRETWNEKQIDWVNCKTEGWGEDIEKALQKQLSWRHK